MDFQLTFSGFASDCWTATPQVLFNEFVSKTKGQLQGLTGIIKSPTTPDVDDQDKMWVRTDAQGREHGYFTYGSGAWTRENLEPASGNARRLFVGTEAQVWSYDGGDGTDPGTSTPSATTGAMWEVDHLFDGRSPMGPGVIPDLDPVVTLGVAADYGSGVHMQDEDELAPHTHPLNADSSIENPGGSIKVVQSGSGAAGLLAQPLTSGNAMTALSVETNEFATEQKGMPIVHPVRGAFLIKRTSRTHYVP